MPPAGDLPCDGDGVCMLCKTTPPEAETLSCSLCATPWHVPCLSSPPLSLASLPSWHCPDCSGEYVPVPAAPAASSDLVASIRAIEADASLSEAEKARRRQMLLGGKGGEEEEMEEEKVKRNDVLELLDEKFNCSFCMQLPERPVTTPCGHNFCLKCFQKWIGQRKNTCAKCRSPIPPKMASLPRINAALVVAIRMARSAKKFNSGGAAQVYHFLRNENRPEKAFTTERAKKAGKANACSGQIFVTIPPDFFGPITAEYDPKRNQGVMVGETWEDRMECRQWGAHFPHVAGIAGQSEYGSQSVALSGGYKDDEDHGEWFLYTGSGGRDLSGNKRTNKEQSFDQKFEKLNGALKVSCVKGYPVRVVRSHKEKRSSYAPEGGVRYDGIYRIEKCWRKIGVQGFKVCRYLFVRCDNEPAPWTSDEHGDLPRPLPFIKELQHATDICERKDSPAWDYDEKSGWKWMKPAPLSKKPVSREDPETGRKTARVIKQARNSSVRERLLKEFCCLICRKVMNLPLTTPCAHNFCKSCLLGSFNDLSFTRERTRGGRTLRAQKIVNKCPCCPTDISEFLQNPQVNRDMMNLIESLQKKSEEDPEVVNDEGTSDVEKSSEEDCKLAYDPKLNEESSDVEAKEQDTATEDPQVNGEENELKLSSEDSDMIVDKNLNEPADCVANAHSETEDDVGELAVAHKRKNTTSEKLALKKPKVAEIDGTVEEE